LTAELAGTVAVLILGPAAAPMLRQAGRFRYQLALQSTDRKALHTLVADLLQRIPTLAAAKKIRWSVDIDPIDCY
jgi:primosomal protein N' (replication factor Y) (superfamily II helicase)